MIQFICFQNVKELENDFHKVSMAEDDECVFLDSCASSDHFLQVRFSWGFLTWIYLNDQDMHIPDGQ